MGKTIVFKTLKPHKRLILRQPFIVQGIHKSGSKKGKLKAKRMAQYCEGLDTIYIDEQRNLTDNPERTNQLFKNSYLRVDDSEIILLEALRSHEDNEANGGNIFKEIDVEKEELFEIEQLEKTDEVKSKLAKTSDNMIITAGVWYFGFSYLHKGIGSIKLRLREAIEKSKAEKPKYKFRDNINTFLSEKNNNEKMIVVIAMKEDIISLRNGKDFVWTDSGELIYSTSQNKYALREFVNHLTVEQDGQKTLAHIVKSIEELLD